MLGETLTTAQTFARTNASAATRSRSTWSMIAMSPGRSRLVSVLVRRSRRATPVTPGWRSPPRGRRSVAILISPESARTALPLTFRRARDREQLLGVAASGDGVGQAAEQAGQLEEPLLPLDSRHA